MSPLPTSSYVLVLTNSMKTCHPWPTEPREVSEVAELILVSKEAFERMENKFNIKSSKAGSMEVEYG